MAPAEIAGLLKIMAQLEVEREKLDFRLKQLQWRADDTRLPKEGQGHAALNGLLQLFEAFQKLDKKELGLLQRKSGARKELRNSLMVVKQAFAKSDDKLRMHRKRLETLARKSTRAFELGNDLAERVEKTIKQIKDKEQACSANIRSTKQKIHNWTKYIPGTNIATYPATRFYKSYCNHRRTSLQDRMRTNASLQKELEATIEKLQGEMNSLEQLHGEVVALRESTSALRDQGEELRSTSRRLVSEAMGWLSTTQPLSTYIQEIQISTDELGRLTDLDDYVRARGRVVAALKSLLKSLSEVSDRTVLDVYEISDDRIKALTKIVEQCEKRVRWSQRGYQSSRNSRSQGGDRGELDL